MHPVKHFDQAIFVALIDGVDALRRERDIEFFVTYKVHLRRNILVLLATKAIDQVQSTALMKKVATAWQNEFSYLESGAELFVDEEQEFALWHAQAYMPLITDAVTQILCEQVLARAQHYFQSLMQCELIELPMYDALNHQALILVDGWKLPQG